MIVDTHCHLDFEAFDDDRHAVIERALAAGVTRIVVPALDMDNGEIVIGLADQYPQVYAAVGVHPNSSASWEEGWIDTIRGWAAHKKVVAIGEIGLDYHWDKSPPKTQKRAFTLQLALAFELDLPVIIHNRTADDDVLTLLQQSDQSTRERPGVLHSFSSSWNIAARAIAMGYYLGFTGPITYKSATELREVVARMPIDRILVETDAPFLSPQTYRGKRNEPAYVVHVVEKIANVRETSVRIVEAMTTENAACVFGRHLITS
jgi:TatD DNase family protein